MYILFVIKRRSLRDEKLKNYVHIIQIFFQEDLHAIEIHSKGVQKQCHNK
jgi:hypothetical protein